MEVELLCLAKERLNLGRASFNNDLKRHRMAKKNQMKSMRVRRIESIQRDTRITTHYFIWENGISSIIHVWPNVTSPQNSGKFDEHRRIGKISTDANSAKIRIGSAKGYMKAQGDQPSAVAKGRMTFFVGLGMRWNQFSICVEIPLWLELARIRPMDLLISVYTPGW